MNFDHFTGAVGAFLGAFTAQLIVNGRIRAFMKMHLDGIYRRLGLIEGKLDLSPQPFPDTDIKPEHISGIWPAK